LSTSSKPESTKVADRLVRDPPKVFGSLRAFGELRYEPLGGLEDRRRCWFREFLL
jgi:hypothetical protein